MFIKQFKIKIYLNIMKVISHNFLIFIFLIFINVIHFLLSNNKIYNKLLKNNLYENINKF